MQVDPFKGSLPTSGSKNICGAKELVWLAHTGTQGRTCMGSEKSKQHKRQGRRSGSGGKKFDKQEVDEEGSCGIMCCNRGYDTIIMTVKERCNCKFHWCCYVECQTCEKDVKLNVCK